VGGRRGSSGGRSSRRWKISLAALVGGATLVAFPALSSATATVPPTVTAGAPTNVTAAGATLNGTVTLNDPDTDGSYLFSWGRASGAYTGSSGGPVAAGATDLAVQATMSSLLPGTTYYFQLCATNSFSSACDAEQSFTTPAAVPSVTTGPATGIDPASATLNGSVNPNGAATTYMFELGTTSGSLTSAGGGSLTAGTSLQSVSLPVSGLSPHTTYYFQLCATNSAGGPVCGSEQSFFAPDQPTTPRRSRRMARRSPAR
jgi:phosphodiesterase/alkaline phosphatase D-like protein